MFVSSPYQQIAGEVGFVEALLDYDLVPLRGVIEARAHGTVPPVDCRRSLRVRRSLVDAVWIVHHDVVAAFSRSSRHRHYDSVASSVIFKSLLLILIVSELEPAAPALLIPVGFDQSAIFQAISYGQRLAVAAEQPPRFGEADPRPRRPENARQQRFGMAWRHVDDEVRDASFGHRLQMGTDGVDVDAFHEIRVRFQNRPSLLHELFEVTFRLLGPHRLELESWLVQGAPRAD